MSFNMRVPSDVSILMLPSEIANLPDLKALVRLKNYDFVLSKWQWEAAKQIHDPFLLRDDLTLESIVANHPAGSAPVTG